MFTHHVLFWLKNADNQSEYNTLLKGIQSLESIEPTVLFHAGVPADTNRAVIDTSYSFSLLIVFNNLKEQDEYQQHPDHLKFVKECSHLWQKVVIYDSIDK